MKYLLLILPLFIISCMSPQARQEKELQERVEKLNAQMRLDIEKKKAAKRANELKYAVPVPNKEEEDCVWIISTNCSNKTCCTQVPQTKKTPLIRNDASPKSSPEESLSEDPSLEP